MELGEGTLSVVTVASVVLWGFARYVPGGMMRFPLEVRFPVQEWKGSGTGTSFGRNARLGISILSAVPSSGWYGPGGGVRGAPVVRCV